MGSSKTAWVFLFHLFMSTQAFLFLHCDSNQPVPKDSYTGLKDPRIPAEFNSLVELCGDYQRGLGIFCAVDWQKLQVFTPLSELFNDANNDYLREECADYCWCDDRQFDDDVAKKAGASAATGYFDVDRETGNPTEPNTGDDEDVNDVNPLPALPTWVSQPPVHTGHPDTATEPRLPTQTVTAPAQTNTPVNPVEAYYVDPYWENGVRCNPDLFGHPTTADCFAAIAGLNDEIRNDDWYSPYRFSHRADPNPNDDDGFFSIPWSKNVGTCTLSIRLLPHEHHRFDRDNADYVQARAYAINRNCVASNAGGWAKAGKGSKAIALYLTGPNAKFNRYLGINETCTSDAEGVTECAYDPDQNAENVDPNTSKPPVVDPNIESGALQPKCGNTCSLPSDCGGKGDDCVCAYDESNAANQQHSTNGFPTSATFGTFTCQIIAGAVAAVAASIQLGTECRGRCLLEANGSLAIANTSTNLPIPAADFSSSPLTCPCNCTYASRGCCLSTDGMVWEDPSQKASTILFGPDNTCCNHKTGNWTAHKASGDEAPNSTKDPACPTVISATYYK